MFIDDDPINNLVNHKILNKYDSSLGIVEHLSAESALRSLSNASAPPPDVILLDINMPEMNGWEFLVEYRRLGLRTKLFMLTSSIAQEDIDRAKQQPEVVEFITKPLDKEKLEIIFRQL
ncbi:MAG: response regulator [Bacteroidia bacterium]|nr:response regulator [Bacteroidia bacterium]